VCITANLTADWQLWVKTGKAQNEQMFSGLPLKADLRSADLLIFQRVRFTCASQTKHNRAAEAGHPRIASKINSMVRLTNYPENQTCESSDPCIGALHSYRLNANTWR
jgi:hypothetical protein